MLKAWGLAEMGKGTETLRGHYPFPFLSLNPCKSLCIPGGLRGFPPCGTCHIRSTPPLPLLSQGLRGTHHLFGDSLYV